MKAKPSSLKLFADTSVARKRVASPSYYRAYLDREIGGSPLYVSRYIRMEYVRGLLGPLNNLLDALLMDHMETFNDASQSLSESFSPRDPKTLLGVMGYFQTLGLDPDSKQDKPRHVVETARLIILYLAKFSDFVDTGQDSTYCARGAVEFPDDISDPRKTVDKFFSRFNAVIDCRARCSISEFLHQKQAGRIEKVLLHRAAFTGDPVSKKSFLDIAGKLEKALAKGEKVSCMDCSSIGDAVIALNDGGRSEILHLDNSFNGLCEPVSQPHRLLDSVTKVSNSLKAGSA